MKFIKRINFELKSHCTQLFDEIYYEILDSNNINVLNNSASNLFPMKYGKYHITILVKSHANILESESSSS